MHSFTEENYLKAIYKLSLTGEAEVSTNLIAAQVNTKAATVTDMLKKLSEKKLLIYRKYQGVQLTATGESAALSIIRKHRLWEVFLVEKLQFKWDEVHEIAEQLEHIQSNELIDELDKFLGYPKFDPHGDPIPDKLGKYAPISSMALGTIKSPGLFSFAGVSEHSKAFLQYISKIGLKIGDTFQLDEIIAYDQSVKISFAAKTVFLSFEAAKHILVEKVNTA